jgi:hypothetical protein
MSRTISYSRLPLKSQIEVLVTDLNWLSSGLIILLVGGIYSVLKSKAPVSTAEYGERYCLIGPLNKNSVRLQTLP